jgi:hypothetical protein
MLVVTGTVELLLPSPLWWRTYLLGFLTASIIGVVLWSLDLLSGTHNLRLGIVGEKATAEAVLARRQRRQGWRLVNGLYFGGYGDVDHILVGPGGVFALESKWTGVEWTVTRDGIVGPSGRDPLSQARNGARKVESMLRLGKERFDVTVQPVVVLWGPGAPSIDSGWTEIGGVLVFEGRRRNQWRSQLYRTKLPESLVVSVTRTLESELNRRVLPATLSAHEWAEKCTHESAPLGDDGGALGPVATAFSPGG